MFFFRPLSKGALPYVTADEGQNIADISLDVNLGSVGKFGGILPADGRDLRATSDPFWFSCVDSLMVLLHEDISFE